MIIIHKFKQHKEMFENMKKEYEIVLPLWAALEMFVGPATRKISRCQPQHPRGTDTVPVGQSTLQKLHKSTFSHKIQKPCDPAMCS